MAGDSTIYTQDDAFVDSSGRRLLLRGVNLSGASKAPLGQPSQRLDGFWETAQEDGDGERIDFTGRPLNLEDGSADEHLERLRGWGYNMLRYPITWEALEHEGPGIYDEEFMDYTIRVLQKCKEYGFRVFLDPHQDIWSRYSGGSGAPYWTLLACGLNPLNFAKTTAALLHSECDNPQEYPAMIWSTNYTRLASQTLFTLFFAGKRYAPKCLISGVNIQEYLQSHFIEAFGRMADRIKAQAPELLDSCIIGWDTMNEPSEGFVGWMDLDDYPVVYTNSLWKGTRPTPAQSLRMGMGQKQEVDVWGFGSFGPKKQGTTVVDPEGASIWADAAFLGEDETGLNARYGWRRESCWKTGICIWALHDVWSPSTGQILLPYYFAPKKPEPDMSENLVHREEEFEAAHWKPHVVAYMKRIHTSHPNAITFLQPPVFAPPPDNMDCEKNFKGRVCYSPHYYDGMTLITRHWHWYNADALGLLRGKYKSKLAAVRIGEGAIRRSLREQLGMFKEDASSKLGPYPTLIGEIGIPYDMDDRKAYGYTDGGKHKGDYSSQIKALDASLNATDGPDAINWTVWNYCPDSSHKWGDQWNREDLSIWSPDDLGLDSSGIRIRRKIQKRASVPPAGDSYPPLTKGTGGMAINSRAALMESTFPSEMDLGAGMVRPGLHGGQNQSMLSLNTLPPATPISMSRSASQIRLPTTTEGGIPTSLSTAMKDEGDLPNAYAFLNSGARAAKAFCRPWPLATAGRVTAMDFDIKKSEMKMSLKVSASSVNSRKSSSTLNSTHDEEDGGNGKGDKEREVVTEIYVPLIHYASDDIVLDSFLPEEDRNRRRSSSENRKSITDAPRSESPVRNQPSRQVDPSPLISKQNSTSSGTLSIDTTSPVSTLAPSSTLNSNSNHTSQPQRYPISASDLSLEVNVSTGRYELRGQSLYWYYTLPSKEEPPVDYSITIKRARGPISEKMVKAAIKARGKIGGEVDGDGVLILRREKGDVEQSVDNLCEWLAGVTKGCVVM